MRHASPPQRGQIAFAGTIAMHTVRVFPYRRLTTEAGLDLHVAAARAASTECYFGSESACHASDENSERNRGSSSKTISTALSITASGGMALPCRYISTSLEEIRRRCCKRVALPTLSAARLNRLWVSRCSSSMTHLTTRGAYLGRAASISMISTCGSHGFVR